MQVLLVGSRSQVPPTQGEGSPQGVDARRGIWGHLRVCLLHHDRHCVSYPTSCIAQMPFCRHAFTPMACSEPRVRSAERTPLHGGHPSCPPVHSRGPPGTKPLPLHPTPRQGRPSEKLLGPHPGSADPPKGLPAASPVCLLREPRAGLPHSPDPRWGLGRLSH